MIAGLLTVGMAQPGASQTGGEGPAATAVRVEWGLVVHGGAGTIRPGEISEEQEAEYRAKVKEALHAGHAVLADGGSAVEAVVAAITILEDAPMFNAGRGAVATSSGTHELDASIMNGADRNAGAVAGVTRVKNPIRLARSVMEESNHVMFAREGAEAFAEEQGLEMVEESYFRTARAASRDAEKFGTVGAVARDRHGDLAAGTSTGGIAEKRWGRVGDSPIIGAGTYADNESCAVSATGQGEFFIRNVVAHDICARSLYREVSVGVAAHAVIMERLVAQEVLGGVVALGADGEIAMPFNTPNMARGWIGPEGRATTAFFREE